jgi:class 3 adenylate cyclase
MAICTHCNAENPEPALFCMRCGDPLPGRRREAASKVVTIVFTDVVRSTKLGEDRDQVVFRNAMTRFFDTARQVFEQYGGTVQKFVGDAIVAVFGVPMLHENDPYRAVKAAYSLHDVLPDLNAGLERDYSVTLRLHTGVNTGELVVGEPLAAYPVVVGDVVNVAARLGQHAEDGEILITDATYRMVRDATEAEQLAKPINLRGRSQPTVAWRLLAVHDHHGRAAPPRSVSPLVGRELDLAELDLQYRRVEREGRCQLVVVRGDAGVGKSRLVEEFAQAVRRRNATVLSLRCAPPHGGPVTTWPVREMLRQAARAQQADPPELIRDRLAEIVGDDRVTLHLSTILGIDDIARAPDEVNRALRQVLEVLAGSGTLVVVVDDLHYAEQSLLDFIAHVVTAPREAPILLLCLARLEFYDEHPHWATNLGNQIPLRPLTARDTERLVGNLLSGGVVDPQVSKRIVQAAEGNPLFVEELVTMLTEQGSLRLVDNQRWEAAADLEAIETPTQIRYVLGARLDRLSETERAVIDTAAVIGRQFAAVDVVALVPSLDEQEATVVLAGLARKELLRIVAAPDTSIDGGRDRFRFRHGLIQEVTYRTIDKETRAELHERYGRWLDEASRSDWTIALHLERAYEYRTELGGDNETTRALARRAGERLAAAGRQRGGRGEPSADAATLLARAVELLPESHPSWLSIHLDLAHALRDRDLTKAIETYDRVVMLAHAAGDERTAMHAALGRLEVQWYNALRSNWDQGRPDIDRAMRVFSNPNPDLRDDLGLAKARRLLAYMYAAKGESTIAREEAEEAIEVVQRVGDDRLEAQIRRLYGVILFWGPAPLEEVVAKNEDAVEWARRKGMYSLEVGALSLLARAAAMRGDIAAARALNDQARGAVGEDEAELLTAAADSISQGLIELLADDVGAAERALRSGYEALERRRATASRANVAALLARALLRQGRDPEAEYYTQICESLAALGQLDTRIKWRGIRAVVMAHRGELAAAEDLARFAVKLARGSEQLDSQAEALTDLADVLLATDDPTKHDEAAELIEEAVELYGKKGNVAAQQQLKRAAKAS